jgi:hypothetical protein
MTGTGSAKEAGDTQRALRVPPFGVVAAALLFGIVLVGGVTVGGYLSTLPPQRPPSNGSGSPGSEATQPQVPSTRPTIATPTEWQTRLHSPSCAAPCAGGLACTQKPTPCNSGFTCVPGLGSSELESTEPWVFHLSAVVETDTTGVDLDPCTTRREYAVCRVGTSECLSQQAACQRPGGAMSPDGIALFNGELLSTTGAFEVHDGGPSGPVVATTRAFPRYGRGALCRGFGIGTDSARIKRLTFFLLPP